MSSTAPRPGNTWWPTRPNNERDGRLNSGAKQRLLWTSLSCNSPTSKLVMSMAAENVALPRVLQVILGARRNSEVARKLLRRSAKAMCGHLLPTFGRSLGSHRRELGQIQPEFDQKHALLTPTTDKRASGQTDSPLSGQFQGM